MLLLGKTEKKHPGDFPPMVPDVTPPPQSTDNTKTEWQITFCHIKMQLIIPLQSLTCFQILYISSFLNVLRSQTFVQMSLTYSIICM